MCHSFFIQANFRYSIIATDSVDHVESEDMKIFIEFYGISRLKFLLIFLKLRGGISLYDMYKLNLFEYLLQESKFNRVLTVK